MSRVEAYLADLDPLRCGAYVAFDRGHYGVLISHVVDSNNLFDFRTTMHHQTIMGVVVDFHGDVSLYL